MPRTCVLGCKITEENKLHLFPKNRERYNIWVERLCGGNPPQRTELHACRRHFHKRFYFQWGLAKTALPEYFLHPKSTFSPNKDAIDSNYSKENSENCTTADYGIRKNSRRVPVMNMPTLLNDNSLNKTQSNIIQQHVENVYKANTLPLHSILQQEESAQSLKCVEHLTSVQMTPSNIVTTPQCFIQNSVPVLPITETHAFQSTLPATTAPSTGENHDINTQQFLDIVLPMVSVQNLKEGVIIYQKDNVISMEYLKSHDDKDKQSRNTEKIEMNIQKLTQKLDKLERLFYQHTAKGSNANCSLEKILTTEEFCTKGKEQNSLLKEMDTNSSFDSTIGNQLVKSSHSTTIPSESLDTEYLENYSSNGNKEKTEIEFIQKAIKDIDAKNKENTKHKSISSILCDDYIILNEEIEMATSESNNKNRPDRRINLENNQINDESVNNTVNTDLANDVLYIQKMGNEMVNVKNNEREKRIITPKKNLVCEVTSPPNHKNNKNPVENTGAAKSNDNQDVNVSKKNTEQVIRPTGFNYINKLLSKFKKKVNNKPKTLLNPKKRKNTLVLSRQKCDTLRLNGSKDDESLLKPLLKTNMRNKLYKTNKKKIITAISTPITKTASNIKTPQSSTHTLRNNEFHLNNSTTQSLSSLNQTVVSTPYTFQSSLIQSVESVVPSNDGFVILDMAQSVQTKAQEKYQEQLPFAIPFTENSVENGVEYSKSEFNNGNIRKQGLIMQKKQNQQSRQPKQQSLLKKNWYMHKTQKAYIPLKSTCASVQTDFTFNGICALVDSTRFHLNCYLCFEYFPLQLWAEFLEHIQTKHNIKKLDDKDYNILANVLESDHDYTHNIKPSSKKTICSRRITVEREIVSNSNEPIHGNNNHRDDGHGVYMSMSKEPKKRYRVLSSQIQKKYYKIRKQNFKLKKLFDLKELPEIMRDSNDNNLKDISTPLKYFKKGQQPNLIEEYCATQDFNTKQIHSKKFLATPQNESSKEKRTIITYGTANTLTGLKPTFQTFDMLQNENSDDNGIIFGKTQTNVVIDFLHNLQKYPLLYKPQKNCYKEDYDEALMNVCSILNEKYHIDISHTELQNSIRRVIDWYYYTLDDIERYNRINRMNKINPLPTYPHDFPEIFEVCAKFLSNIQISDYSLINPMTPNMYQRYNQPITYPSWIKFQRISIDMEKSKKQSLNETVVSRASSSTLPQSAEYPMHSLKEQQSKEQVSNEERQKKIVKIAQLKKKYLKNYTLKCKICGQKFRNESLFRVHTRLYQPPCFNCEYCGKKYHYYYQLQRHFKAQHKKFPCSI